MVADAVGARMEHAGWRMESCGKDGTTEDCVFVNKHLGGLGMYICMTPLTGRAP
jgi:hypothetical protein